MDKLRVVNSFPTEPEEGFYYYNKTLVKILHQKGEEWIESEPFFTKESSGATDDSGSTPENPAEEPAPEPTPTLSDVIDMSPEFWWHLGDAYTDSAMTTPATPGDQVYTIADQSSNNRKITAQSPDYATYLETNTDIGHNYIDGGTAYSNNPFSPAARYKFTSGSDISTPACIYAVMKIYSAVGNGTLWMATTSGTGHVVGSALINMSSEPHIIRSSMGLSGNQEYGAQVVTDEIKIYQYYASGTEIGIRVNGGALEPHYNSSQTLTPAHEDIIGAGKVFTLLFGAKADIYEFGLIPDVTHDQDKVFRYLGDKYNISVTDVS